MNELVGGLGYAVKKLVDVPVAGLALHCGSTMLIVRSCEQLCGTECHLQYLDSGHVAILEAFFCCRKPKKQSVVGDGILPEVLLIC